MSVSRFVNLFYRIFFTLWFRLSDRFTFATHHYEGRLPVGKKPVLMLCNHMSWWDGIWMLLWNERSFHKDFNVLMLQEELRKRPFLKALGAVGLPKDRTFVAAVAQLKAICLKPNALLLIFPEGQIRAAQAEGIIFSMGILRRLPLQQLQLAFAYNAVEYGNTFRPMVFQFVEPTDALDLEAVEAAYNAFVGRCKRAITLEIDKRTMQA